MTTTKETRGTSPKQRRGALGKGFNSLLGLEGDEQDSGQTNTTANPTFPKGHRAVLDLSIDAIEPNPHQPRKLFNDEALRSLTASVKEDGILQPLVVAKGDTTGRYTLIAGERRWRAARLAGLATVPAIVKELVPEEMLRLALIENIQRSDLSIIEEAEAYASLIRDFGLTQEQCAKKVGKDRSTVTNALRLLSLPRELQDDLMEDRLTMGHGRALLALEDKKLILRARDVVIKKELSVRQTEQLIKTYRKKGSLEENSNSTAEKDANLEYIAETLRSHLRTKVKVSGTGSRGKIEVSYFSAAELERILGVVGAQF